MYILIAVLILFFGGACYLLYKKSSHELGPTEGGRSENNNSNDTKE